MSIQRVLKRETKNVDTPDSLKTAQKMQAQSDKMQKLASSNDVLQKEYQRTEERAESLRKAIGRILRRLRKPIRYWRRTLATSY